MVCSAGTAHPVTWIAWLSGVCSSQAQNLSSAGVRIELRRIMAMTGGAGVVDAPAGGEERAGILGLRRRERALRGVDQASRRLHPSIMIARTALAHERAAGFGEHRRRITHGVPLLLGAWRDLLGAFLGGDRLH